MNATSAWIETISGKRIVFSAVDPDALDIDDIAHALAHINRFCGHTTEPFSVAAHSLLAAAMMADWARWRGQCVSTWALCGLLHDAAEAYVSDLPAPLKHLPELAAYRSIETDLQRAIFAKFGLVRENIPSDALKMCDTALLAAEASVFKRLVRPADWGINWALADLVPLAALHELRNSTADEIRQRFVDCHDTLARERGAHA